jgi:hypothetical protein
VKVAVWRLGAGFQTDMDSKVGGGKIARRTVEMLATHHDVTICSNLSAPSATWARNQKVNTTTEPDMHKFDAVVVLTGPFNPLYKSLFKTYERLAAFEGRVYYAWWDTALPFHFAAERNKQFAKACSVTMGDLQRGKEWTVLTQLANPVVSKAKTVAFEEFAPKVERCFWELFEAESRTQYTTPKHWRFAYFGSPRAGRIKELERWFGQSDSPPLDLYGKWKDSQLAAFSNGHVEFKGPVQEHEVRPLLKTYAATLHSADNAYIRSDFIAQRFIENAAACVPVAYSDRMQPSVEALMGTKALRHISELSFWWRMLDADNHRKHAVEHSKAVMQWARNNEYTPSKVFKL